MSEALHRHTMVKPSKAGWTAILAQHPELAEQPIIESWARAGHPLVVRRPNCGDLAGMIPLGLPLPPLYGKRRITLALASSEIIERAPPPLLADAATTAPPAWQETIDRLLRLLPETRTFGSLAWQHLTGLPYLSDGSDLDLLWPLSSTRETNALLSAIAEIARHAPMRLDGEIVGAAGGVQWRELIAADEHDILVKGPVAVHTMSRTAFLSGAVP
ncbi:malonate decarboxylase holo-[acyl-carrier-protein] synthase [Bradyrhizobium sp. STM 3562]|uniref:malonate decarboxylase holo-[acyl-carrier-protein] synthase n=1 Tax=Bradyrhizobium sp. STM 3562 TaxID=578924 RepID=UPI00388E47E2